VTSGRIIETTTLKWRSADLLFFLFRPPARITQNAGRDLLFSRVYRATIFTRAKLKTWSGLKLTSEPAQPQIFPSV
jgi:hypothetical protein